MTFEHLGLSLQHCIRDLWGDMIIDLPAVLWGKECSSLCWCVCCRNRVQTEKLKFHSQNHYKGSSNVVLKPISPSLSFKLPKQGAGGCVNQPRINAFTMYRKQRSSSNAPLPHPRFLAALFEAGFKAIYLSGGGGRESITARIRQTTSIVFSME